MRHDVIREFVAERFGQQLGARPCTDYQNWQHVSGAADRPAAALAYRSARSGPLFLETYIEQPIERMVSDALGRIVERSAIVEIGCLAAIPGPALLKLWSETSELLAADHEIAVATMTAPLRRMFARIGMPVVMLAQANIEAIAPEKASTWGRYYDLDPMLCAGHIGVGAIALARYSLSIGAFE
jgi:hypothetical protein